MPSKYGVMSSCCAFHLRDSTVLVNYDENRQDYMLSITHEHSYEYAAMAQWYHQEKAEIHG